MQSALTELPLAIFTTLAPIGAGTFIAMAIAFGAGKFSDEQLQRADKLSLLPLGLTLVGFIASVVHLANPAGMFGALSGLGSSPLSNEVTVGGIFVAFAFVYCILALMGKFSESSRKTFALVVGIVGLVFALFTGLAYAVETIPSWNNFAAIIQPLGYALVGGAAVGCIVVRGENTGRMLVMIAIVGTVVSIIGVAGQLAIASGLETAVASGSEVVGEVLLAAVAGLVLVVLAAVLVFLSTSKDALSFAYAALVCSVAGVFVCRLTFYALEISVGLTI